MAAWRHVVAGAPAGSGEAASRNDAKKAALPAHLSRLLLAICRGMQWPSRLTAAYGGGG